MTEITIQELMDHLPEFFAPARAGGISAIVQFEVSGQEGGEWAVKIEDRQCLVSRGKADAANLTFLASAKDVLDIFYNRLDPMKAYLKGRISFKGNLNLALRLFNLFDMDSAKLDGLRGNRSV